MKSGTKLLFCLGAAALLAGCMQATQPEERAIVQAAAVDFEDNVCAVTLQIYDPAANGQEQTGDNAYRLLYGRGQSLTAAFAEAEAGGQQLYLGSCRLLLCGQSAADRLEELLRFFNDRPQTRATTLVGLVRGSAGALLNLGEGAASPSPAAAVEQELTLAQKEKRLPTCRLMELLAAAGTDGRDGVVPLLEAVGSGDAAHPALVGSVVVPRGLELDPGETALLGWCSWGRGSLVLGLSEGENDGAVVLLERFSPSLGATLQNGTPHLTVRLRATGRLSEGAATEAELAQVEQAAAQQMAEQMEQLLGRLCAAGCDPLRFGERLRRADFRAWQQAGQSWAALLPQARWTVEAECRLTAYADRS